MNYDAVAFWSQIAGFVLFAAAFVWAWQKFLMPAIRNAQRTSNERIALAEQHRDDMQAALEVLRREIEGAHRDADAMTERVQELAKHESERIVREAQAAAERTLANASQELQRARVAARTRMREQMASRALDLARQEARERVDDAANDRLVQLFVTSLERGSKN
jgi:F0F1-type ATP synthase membrane subunit b/b'